MNSMTSPLTAGPARGINRSCVLRRNVETQPYGRCSVCELQLRDCHAWQSNGFSFALVVLSLSLLLLPAGWPQQAVVAVLLALIVWQGLANHRRTDELIFGAHRMMALTQELRGQQLVIEHQNLNLAAQVDARTAELRDANLRLAAANLELLELDRMRTAVMSNVSHELRTPLTGILGSAQNLRDGLAGPLNPAQVDYVRLIENDSGRLIRVVNELLECGRLQAGQANLRRAPVAVRPLVDEVFTLVRAAADGKRVQLNVSGDAALADADPDKLKQILINLVDNAVKFSPPGAPVQVRVAAGPDALTIEVEDAGPGVPPEDVPFLFERFFRGRGAEAAPGSGLGLAIAKNLARLHGGDVALRQPAAAGSIFSVSLPCA